MIIFDDIQAFFFLLGTDGREQRFKRITQTYRR